MIADLKRLRNVFTQGTRIELMEMDDPQAPPAGTRGTVLMVDDVGSLIVRWDNGSSLNVLHGVDRVRILRKRAR